MNPLASIKRINNALREYYEQLNHEYNDNFLEYCLNEEMVDEQLPISRELGPRSTPEDCAYTALYYQYGFVVPRHLSIPTDKIEQYVYYILQYCHEHGKPPSKKCMIHYYSPIKKNKNIPTNIKSLDIKDDIIKKLNEPPISTKIIASMNYITKDIRNNEHYFCNNFLTKVKTNIN